MARSYSGVIADRSLEERRGSVFRHAENTVSNKGIKERAISGFIINAEESPQNTPRSQDWLTIPFAGKSVLNLATFSTYWLQEVMEHVLFILRRGDRPRPKLL